jgi:hypothetical protein
MKKYIISLFILFVSFIPNISKSQFLTSYKINFNKWYVPINIYLFGSLNCDSVKDAIKSWKIPVTFYNTFDQDNVNVIFYYKSLTFEDTNDSDYYHYYAITEKWGNIDTIKYSITKVSLYMPDSLLITVIKHEMGHVLTSCGHSLFYNDLMFPYTNHKKSQSVYDWQMIKEFYPEYFEK